MQTKEHVAIPMDFSHKNRVSFYDFHRLTLGLHEPGRSVLGLPSIDLRPHIHAPWLHMLKRSMAIYPSASKNPVLSSKSMNETRFKPLLAGIRMAGLTDIDIYYANKSGKAYGFHVDNAFIATGTGVGRIQPDGRPGGRLRKVAIVTMGLYANANKIINDNRYEYTTVTIPFFKAMGFAIGRYLQGKLKL